MALSPRFRALVPKICCLCLVAYGCSTTDTNDDSTVDRIDPPVLSFLGATSADGTTFGPDATEIELGCDARVTFHFDSEENENSSGSNLWDMQPPGLCDDDETEPCGYLRVDLESASGERLARGEAALYDVLADLSSVRGEVASVRAVFIQGTSKRPFEVRGKTIEKTWEVDVLVPSDCGSGAGGSPAVGGAGGLGGAI